MNDSNMANPAPAPGSAHSVSPTVRSTFRDDSVSSQSTGCQVREGRARRSGGHTGGCSFTGKVAWTQPYFGALLSPVGMFLYQREVGEELWQLFGDLPSDRSGGVLEFWRRHPAGNDVVGVHLQKKTRRLLVFF